MENKFLRCKKCKEKAFFLTNCCCLFCDKCFNDLKINNVINCIICSKKINLSNTIDLKDQNKINLLSIPEKNFNTINNLLANVHFCIQVIIIYNIFINFFQFYKEQIKDLILQISEKSEKNLKNKSIEIENVNSDTNNLENIKQQYENKIIYFEEEKNKLIETQKLTNEKLNLKEKELKNLNEKLEKNEIKIKKMSEKLKKFKEEINKSDADFQEAQEYIKKQNEIKIKLENLLKQKEKKIEELEKNNKTNFKTIEKSINERFLGLKEEEKTRLNIDKKYMVNLLENENIPINKDIMVNCQKISHYDKKRKLNNDEEFITSKNIKNKNIFDYPKNFGLKQIKFQF